MLARGIRIVQFVTGLIYTSIHSFHTRMVIKKSLLRFIWLLTALKLENLVLNVVSTTVFYYFCFAVSAMLSFPKSLFLFEGKVHVLVMLPLFANNA